LPPAQLLHCESVAVLHMSDEVQLVTGVQNGQVSATPLAR
jgi:hypothetical protein